MTKEEQIQLFKKMAFKVLQLIDPNSQKLYVNEDEFIVFSALQYNLDTLKCNLNEYNYVMDALVAGKVLKKLNKKYDGLYVVSTRGCYAAIMMLDHQMKELEGVIEKEEEGRATNVIQFNKEVK